MTAYNHKNLPSQIPVFPLNGTLLLPGGRLPLHIFEPRYLDMINSALKKDGLFGMVQTKALEHQSLPKTNLLYPIGCLGEIAEVTELDNGGLDIIVLGITRYKILMEVEDTTPYRQVMVDYKPFNQDFKLLKNLKKGGRQKLLKIVDRYMAKQGLSLNKSTLKELGDGELVIALAMLCPFDSAEKQALLENHGINKGVETLSALMEFAIADIDDISKVAQH
ncbi:MAG: LON peptidase substrate-binding domain-containing protein [Sphingomonadales bacterium]|jgi:Lon protease-like protein